MNGLLAEASSGRSMWLDDDARWDAVVRRDHAADGLFYYSVKTTGVYCRPSCSSRRARRENVRFHDSRADAEAAGFRPCKRCRPDLAAPAIRNAEKVVETCRRIENADDMPDLDTLARDAGMSRFHFHRLFRSVVGLTPKAYADACRARRVREALAAGAEVTAALYDAGFGSSGRFYAASTAILGMQPQRYRAGGQGETIRFALGQCSLGTVLVAATDKGVCAIQLGDEPERLLHELQDRFPRAQLVGGDADFETWMAQIVGLIEAPRQGLELPLDIRGTVFQQRVWQALREIPVGTTVTYTELAQRLGMPRAVRAVAQACAANALAVAIPCHRVLRLDGDLAGYRWGIARKRALLEREGAR